MGADTKLYINKRFDVEDVAAVIEHYVLPQLFDDFSKPKIIAAKNAYCGYITFGNPQNMRSMFYYTIAKTPLGPCNLFSLGLNEQSIKIMTIIAEVLGGIVQEHDTYDNYKMYGGRLDEDDGLSYFIKYAVIHEGNDGRNIKALKETIDKWKSKYRQ